MKTFYTACRETGDFIEKFEHYSQAVSAIRKYEEADVEERTYVPDFYDIVDENHCSVCAED